MRYLCLECPHVLQTWLMRAGEFLSNPEARVEHCPNDDSRLIPVGWSGGEDRE